MPYIKRDANGEILAVYKSPVEAELEEIGASDIELVAFFLEGFDFDELKRRLYESDLDMGRVSEDLVDTLIEKGVILFTDLPEAAQRKLNARRLLRKRLGSSIGLIDSELKL